MRQSKNSHICKNMYVLLMEQHAEMLLVIFQCISCDLHIEHDMECHRDRVQTVWVLRHV